MISSACRPAACLLLLLLGVSQAVGAPNTLVNRIYDPKTKTRVTVTALIDQLPTSGYAPVRVFINNGTKIPRTWTFRFTSTDSGWSHEGNEVRSSFSAPCEAGQNKAYEFLVPLVTAFQQGYTSSADLDVSVSATALPPASGSMDTVYDEGWPSVFLSDTLFKRNGSDLASETNAHISGSSHGGSSSIQFGGQFDPKQMSDDWRAYCGYDACLLTDGDWRDLSPGARSAILQWNRMGGTLTVYASSPSIDAKSLGIDDLPAGTKKTIRSWGQLVIRNIPSAQTLNGSATVKEVDKAWRSMSGRHRLHSLRNDFHPTWPLQVAFGSKTAHIVFFILVLIAFGILVGPVNLFVFAKSGQRHRLFITTPIISIGASLLLIVLIIFQDGFGGRGTRVLLMEVRPDNNENAAYLVQEQVARTGVLFSTGFTTSEPGYLTPVLIEESRWARVTESNDGGNGRYTIDLEENGLQVGGDWFQSRSEHGHYFETVRSTRGRIELVSNDPVPVVMSTFEFPLETLYYVTPDGTHWLGEDVQQGRNTKLKAAASTQFDSWVLSQRGRFAPMNQQRLDVTAKRKGHFVATSPDVAAVETLGTIGWKETQAVITGPVVNP